jgi:hypothetical protein
MKFINPNVGTQRGWQTVVLPPDLLCCVSSVQWPGSCFSQVALLWAMLRERMWVQHQPRGGFLCVVGTMMVDTSVVMVMEVDAVDIG